MKTSFFRHRFAAILTVGIMLASLFCVAGCRRTSSMTVSDILSEIVSSYDIQPPGICYIADAPEGKSGYLDEKTKTELFGTTTDDSRYNFNYLRDFALYIPSVQTAFEVDVFWVRNLEDISDIETMCNRRIDALRAASLSFSEKDRTMLEHAETYTVGRYVFLLITPDNRLAKTVIRSVI